MVDLEDIVYMMCLLIYIIYIGLLVSAVVAVRIWQTREYVFIYQTSKKNCAFEVDYEFAFPR